MASVNNSGVASLIMTSTPLYVEKSGNPSGPTIIFLHAIGTSGWMWQEQVELLTNFNCVVPDLPGHGKSNHVPWHSFSDTARLVTNLIQAHASSGKAHIVGLSLGAYVGMQLLSESQAVTERVILSGLNVLPLPNKRVMFLMGYLIAPLMKMGLTARMNASALNIPEDQFEAYRRISKQISMRAFLKASEDAGNFKMPDNIDTIETPTLIVAGEKEHALILESQKALVKTMLNAQAYIAPDVGHGWSGESPELFAQMVRAWTQEQPLPDQLQPVA